MVAAHHFKSGLTTEMRAADADNNQDFCLLADARRGGVNSVEQSLLSLREIKPAQKIISGTVFCQ